MYSVYASLAKVTIFGAPVAYVAYQLYSFVSETLANMPALPM